MTDWNGTCRNGHSRDESVWRNDRLTCLTCDRDREKRYRERKRTGVRTPIQH